MWQSSRWDKKMFYRLSDTGSTSLVTSELRFLLKHQHLGQYRKLIDLQPLNLCIVFGGGLNHLITTVLAIRADQRLPPSPESACTPKHACTETLHDSRTTILPIGVTLEPGVQNRGSAQCSTCRGIQPQHHKFHGLILPSMCFKQYG